MSGWKIIGLLASIVLAGCQFSVDSPNLDLEYDTELGFSFSLYLGSVALIDSGQTSGEFSLKFQAKGPYRLQLFVQSDQSELRLAQYQCDSDCAAQQRHCVLQSGLNGLELGCEANPSQSVSAFAGRSDTRLQLQLCDQNGQNCQVRTQAVELR